MSKTLNFTYEGTDYTLEFTKRTVTEMERRGFIADDIDRKPMTTLPALFAGAFLAHHRGTNSATIEKIYDSMTNKEELIGKLADMYNEPIMGLVENPKGTKGNISWTANF